MQLPAVYERRPYATRTPCTECNATCVGEVLKTGRTVCAGARAKQTVSLGLQSLQLHKVVVADRCKFRKAKGTGPLCRPQQVLRWVHLAAYAVKCATFQSRLFESVAAEHMPECQQPTLGSQA